MSLINEVKFMQRKFPIRAYWAINWKESSLFARASQKKLGPLSKFEPSCISETSFVVKRSGLVCIFYDFRVIVDSAKSEVIQSGEISRVSLIWITWWSPSVSMRRPSWPLWECGEQVDWVWTQNLLTKISQLTCQGEPAVGDARQDAKSTEIFRNPFG